MIFRGSMCIGLRADGEFCTNRVKNKVNGGRCDECWEDLSIRADSSQMKEIATLDYVPDFVMDQVVEAAKHDFMITMALTNRDDLSKEQKLTLIDAMFETGDPDPVWLAHEAGTTNSTTVLERIAHYIEHNPSGLDDNDMREIAYQAKNAEDSMWNLLSDDLQAIFNVYAAI